MAPRPSRSVVSLQGVTLGEHRLFGSLGKIDLELPRRGAALVQVDDEADAVALLDVCLGISDPHVGRVHFLGVDWTTRTPAERMHRRRRIGAVVRTEVWPAHMTILDAVLLPGAYHFDRSREEVMEHATALARLFGLPGLPTGRRETTLKQVLMRAACVRGFLGSPDLILLHDAALEQTPELAEPMAQAISAARDRGAAVLWITAHPAAQATKFVEAEQILRLGEHGLMRARRGR